MGKIIDLNSVKPSPHMTGKAHCITCNHKWVAVIPAGIVWLECPNCESMKGLLDFPCSRNGLIWFCGCGNSLFEISPDEVLCPNCGATQKGF